MFVLIETWQVYLTLCSALISAALGAYAHILYNIGGTLTMLACVGCIVWLMSIPQVETTKRVRLLMAVAALQGSTLGPLIEYAIDVDIGILVTAFVGTALSFTCFSMAALVAKRREYLYLGGFLGSGISILMWVRLASFLFGNSVAMFNVELYMGLVLFLGYIIFDTQMIIENAHHGDLNYVNHALELFTDFVAVFVRILIIMLKNKSEKAEREKRKKRSD